VNSNENWLRRTALAPRSGDKTRGAPGDNSDPETRARLTREALDGLDECDADAETFNNKLKGRRDKHRGVLKTLGHKMGDLAFPRRMRTLKRAIDDADNPKDRAAAQARFDAALASAIECVAYVDEDGTTGGQLDFNGILERGEKARAPAAAKTTVTDGKKKH
jgi:hypothetical protein